MKIELVQLAGRDGDVAWNTERTLEAIRDCARDTDLLLFPETQLSGFPTEANVGQVAQAIDGPAVASVLEALKARRVSAVLGMAEADAGRYYNTTLLLTPDGIKGRYRKTHLWASDRGVFTPGDHFVTVPFMGARIGLLICYDIEFPETARALAHLGADVLLVTNGNMDPYGPVHRAAIMSRAIENQAFAVMVNRVGEGDGGLTFAGGSAAVDPFGRMLCEAGRDPQTLTVELDLALLQDVRRDYRYLQERRIVLPGEVEECADGSRTLRID
ncbi:carbon-nitrogen hydrolase family protein [Pseudomonas sp. Marseille-QA0892]